MGAIRNAIRRAARLWVGLTVLPLPYRARLAVARMIDLAAHPGLFAEMAPVRWHLRFWNALVLGLVFFLGFPLPRLVYAVASVFRRRRVADTYWRPRPDPERLDRGIGEPF